MNTRFKKGRIPWNKGKKGVCIAWNKGTHGLMNTWHKGRKNVYSTETLRKMSIAKGGTGETKHTLICPVCDKSFEVPHYNFNHGAKFCSISCSKKGHHYGVGRKLSAEHIAHMSSARKGRKFPNQSGKKHPNWHGGKMRTAKGYIKILNHGHPFADYYGYVTEHRLVAERILDRFLTPEEVIHHINGNKADNRPENLYLFPCGGEHTKYHNKKYKLVSNLNLVSETS